MPVDPPGFEQFDYDSIKYAYQDPNPGAKPLDPGVLIDRKKFDIEAPPKSEKSKKDTKKDPKGKR